jgi:hypothetical protein
MFRRQWYTCFFFAFRQNLYITNLSYAELISLLDRHITTRDERAIQFYHSKTLKAIY